MIRSLRALTFAFAVAAIPLAALAQPGARHDSYGKVVKLTSAEIDLEVTEKGVVKVKVYVIATYAKSGPVKVGEMAKVHYYTDDKGVDIAEILTASGDDKGLPTPRPQEAQDPAGGLGDPVGGQTKCPSNQSSPGIRFERSLAWPTERNSELRHWCVRHREPGCGRSDQGPSERCFRRCDHCGARQERGTL
jgi:hypothetical protein